MVPRLHCSVGGLTFSRNFFKPLLPRHIWRKIQLESDSLPYNQLIFSFFLPIFFLQLDRKAIPKRPADPKPPEILRSRLPGYFPTSFSSRGLQGPHHHHLYHHHHVRRDGPSDQPTRYHHQRKPTRRTTNSTFSRTEDEHSITTIHKNTTRILVGTESVRRFPSSRRS